MSEREYIVSLKAGVDYDQFNQDMIASTGAGDIPNRTVDVANARPGSKRNTHYALTDAEASALRNDPRVAGVEIPPNQDPSLEIGIRLEQDDDFTKTTSNSGSFVNWGLRRMNSATNPYSGNTVSTPYGYTLTGRNVDYVVQDTGIYFGHPEFADDQGNDRLNRINWYSASGISGSQPGGFYSDYHGHGTHVASTSIGARFGWGKNANLYALKVQGLEGPSDPNSGIPVQDCFDVIKLWHRNKAVNPLTGLKNPTVVNMSWGYSSIFYQITGGNYRGTPWTGTTRQTQYGMTGSYYLGFYRHPVRLISIDTDIEEMIDEGIHVCIASGNNYMKGDVEGGVDYDNYYTSASWGDRYYHRGGSPYSDRAFMVGSIDSVLDGGGLERVASYSNKGPATNIYAPGTDICAASSAVSVFANGPYPTNSFYRQANISGTSMASPQVAGLLTLYLEMNPTATPAQAKANIINNAQTGQIRDTGLDDDYTDYNSIMGGTDLFATNKFNSGNPWKIRYPFAPTYSLSAPASFANEGDTLVITLNTTNVADGTSIPYTITGVTTADINGELLNGSFVVNAVGVATLSLTFTEDFAAEGNEQLTLALDNGKSVISIEIVDTSTEADIPTYTLSSSAASVNEGQSFVITLTTTNVDDATNIPYTITGISSNDIGGAFLTGSFTVSNGTAEKTFSVTEDLTTEGNESFTLSLDNGEDDIVVLIADTSINPTYTLSTVDSVTSINEGESVTVVINTTSIPDGTTIPFTITGVTAGDFTGSVDLTDNFTITDGTDSKTYTFGYDVLTEGQETMTVSLDNGEDSIAITIGDVSLTRPAGTTFNIDVTNVGSASWNMVGTDQYGSVNANNPTLEIDYGDTLVFDVSSLNYNFYVKTTNTTGTDDLVEGVTGNGTDNGIVTFYPDRTGTFYYTHPTFSAMSGAINVVLNRQRFTLSSPDTAVSEGDTITINLTTTNVEDGTLIPYSIVGLQDADLVSGTRTGNFTVNSNAAQETFTLVEDFATEGAELFRLTLDNGLATIDVTVNDTSIAGGTEYTVGITNDTNIQWLLSGEDANGTVSGANTSLTIAHGDTLVFNVNASGHPLYIQDDATLDPAKDVTVSGTREVGAVTFIPEGPGTFTYYCGNHSGTMYGTITVTS